MCLPWYLAVLGVNTPFKFAVFVREGAAPLPCIKGDRDSDRPWGQISQNQSKNDKKGKIVQRSQLCDHLVGRRDTMKAESNETLPVSEKYMLTIKEAAAYFNIGICKKLSIKVAVEQHDTKTTVPYLHVFLDNTWNLKNCAFIRLDKPEYVPEKNSKRLSTKGRTNLYIDEGM